MSGRGALLIGPMVSIRYRPGHEVVRTLKRLRIRQIDIAVKAGVTSGYVSKVINRRVIPSAHRERVWAVIEAAVNGGGE
jgi:predicted transcriptional regulator